MIKIYLAVPYSHPDPIIKEHRFNAVNKKAAQLINQGYIVYSPISHSHPIHLVGKLPAGWDFWKQYDTAFIEWCDELWVYELPGWDDSVGIKAEIEIARKFKKYIKFIKPGIGK